MEYPRKQSAEAWAQQLNFASIERNHGLPAGVLTNLVRQESGGNCDAKSPAGAKGLCQFMPKTAASLNVNASDPVSSVNGAAQYLEDLMDMFQGDPVKAIAAYNCGPGRLRGVIRKYGDDWRAHLKDEGLGETADYINKVGKGVGPSYLERENDASLSEAERAEAREVETRRRTHQLERAGIPPFGEILGAMFFALIASFLDTKYKDVDGPAAPAIDPARVAEASMAENKVPAATPAAPRLPQKAALAVA